MSKPRVLWLILKWNIGEIRYYLWMAWPHIRHPFTYPSSPHELYGED